MDLSSELASLDAEEREISRRRTRLHQQIDFVRGSPVIDAERLQRLLEEEREVSGRRRELHRRIDGVRTALGMEPWRAPARQRLLG